MMSDSRCLICLELLPAGESGSHAVCCRRLFAGSQPPKLPFTWSDLNAAAGKVIRSHVSVPGVQPKLSLHLEDDGKHGGGQLTVVGLEGGYILKPPVERFPEMPELEHLTMRMATCFGIETATCGLIEMQDRKRALIVRRMDRVGSRKLPMEDMAQLTDRLTEEKYRGSLETVGKTILRHCTNPGLDLLRFFDLTLFCFLTGNADMHLKNFSLLRRHHGEIHLAPAYDLLPTTLLLPKDREESALTLNGRKRKLRATDFRQFGAALGLTERQMANAIRRIEKGLHQATVLLPDGFCSGKVIERYENLLSERWLRIAG